MKGYWHKPEATAEVLDAEGWFKSGDIAVIDPDGFVRIVDRKKDMIIVSGFNVYPNEIEDVIMAHPKVANCAVIGVPDERSGEAVKLFIEEKERSRRKSTADGYKWLLERFPFKGQLSDIASSDLARTLKAIKSRSTYDHALVAAHV